jgi:EAL domain-containing protein (putative c-di-GMP-specific phosphodiesterase class I)
MLDPDQAITTISTLRAIGVSFALDDFGTGYSSLAYLKNLQVQSIKIDRSFVRDMVSDQRDASIVRAAIELGHSFNLGIVAEGVESGGFCELLGSLGCDYAQGYHLARPMRGSEFLSWYAQHDHRPN